MQFSIFYGILTDLQAHLSATVQSRSMEYGMAQAEASQKRLVFVSGCYDMLHSGHMQFFRTAVSYGEELVVAVASDATIQRLKGRPPVICEQERLFTVQQCKSVRQAYISRGTGYLDFETLLREIRPQVFVVNGDGGDRPEKRELCQELGIEYVVLDRVPKPGLTPRSTTDLRKGLATECRIPFRIDLAGAWLDQPFVSKQHPGAVITMSLDPSCCNSFDERSGMASSTRKAAQRLWGNHLPSDRDTETLARILFCCDNPPGYRDEVSGAQDSIGIVFSGLALSMFEGEYWPTSIQQDMDNERLKFVENLLYLIPLGPRSDDYNVLSDTHVTVESTTALADAAHQCWKAIQDKDEVAFGQSVRASFEAQISMFPLMMNDDVDKLIGDCREKALGWKLSGTGGGGYLILVSQEDVPGAIRIQARRGH